MIANPLWAEFWNARNYPGIIGEFVKLGDLVFDIGANVGKMTAMYLDIGARVLAVEPQVHCAALLAKAFTDNDNFEFELAACGPENGVTIISIYGGTTISTLVPRRYWQDDGPWANTPKDGEDVVDLITLDSLIEKYGVPSFIKIDVEGYEFETLQGLSQFVPLSFEYHPFFRGQAAMCMERIWEIEPKVEFGRVCGESLALESGWKSAVEVNAELEQLYADFGKDYFGNIYARKAV